MVPEADNAVTLVVDHLGAWRVDRRLVLAAVHFDHQLRPVTGEIRDEVADRNLSPEMLLGKALAEDTPKLPLGIGHIPAQTPSARDRTNRRMMFQRCRS